MLSNKTFCHVPETQWHEPMGTLWRVAWRGVNDHWLLSLGLTALDDNSHGSTLHGFSRRTSVLYDTAGQAYTYLWHVLSGVQVPTGGVAAYRQHTYRD